MALVPLAIQPGIYTEASDKEALNRYKAGSNVRFYKGFMQKIGGYGKALAQVMGVDPTFVGICRALLSWVSLTAAQYLGLGTHLKLYVLYNGTYYDVTPIRDSGTLGVDPFSTTNTSSTVTVHDVGHGLTAGDYIHFSGATAVATLNMNAEWTVDTVVDVDNYTFIHTGVANATTTGGGAAVAYSYEIPIGFADSISGGGWGGGAWGAGTWGTPRNVINQCRTWSLDNWGEDMIASPHRGGIYVWDASVGTGTRATLITQAPEENLIVKVSEENRQLISFGGTDPDTGAFDPMLVQGSDNEDYTQWTPAETNRAFSKRLDRGNTIVDVFKSRGQFAIVTDQTLYTMALSGDEFVFDFKGEGDVIGGVSPNGGFDVNGTVYYMGRGQFVRFAGQVEILPCDVLSFVFTVDAARGFLGINMAQSAKVFCGRNKTKSELIWFYPSAGSQEIDRCVGYCFEPGNESWWLGAVARTAWLDENVLFEEPVAVADNGILYVHETGVDADGAALAYSVSTYDMELPATTQSGKGEFVMKVRRMVPDYQRIEGTAHAMTLQGRKWPNAPMKTKGPRTFGATSQKIGLRIRARQVSFKIEGNEVGGDISLGQWRVDLEPTGQR